MRPTLTAVEGGLDHPLREWERPDFEVGEEVWRHVDLFAGAGGITLGVAQAAHVAGLALDVRLAVDNDIDAIGAFAKNFPKASTSSSSIVELLDGELGTEPTAAEAALRVQVGEVDGLVGGPPCQGNSNLNNHTRRVDPKNALYLRMVRAVEILTPKVVMIENVPAVVHATPDVVTTTRQKLVDLGYSVADHVLDLSKLGVAQKRKRHVLVATTSGFPTAEEVLASVTTSEHAGRTLRWAIEDLVDTDPVGFDQPPTASAENVKRMQWMLDNSRFDLPNDLRPPCHQDGRTNKEGELIAHSYKSMYGRLSWDAPAQTITSGYGSIGQGRYMHPDRPRALTPHEAARIQGFPDYFTFESVTRRASLATIIGNAVPPALSQAVFNAVLSPAS